MSILERLEDRRIFKVTPREDGNFNFAEQCDDCFEIMLTPAEVRQLIKELEALLT